jgi:hypothetical protein
MLKYNISVDRFSKESVQVRSLLWNFVRILFLRREFISLTPNSQAGGPPFVGCPRLLIRNICSYPPYLEVDSTRHAVVTMGPLYMELPHSITSEVLAQEWSPQLKDRGWDNALSQNSGAVISGDGTMILTERNRKKVEEKTAQYHSVRHENHMS